MEKLTRGITSSITKCAAAIMLCVSVMGCVATTSGYKPGLVDGVLTARYGADLPITVYYPKNSTASAHPVLIFNHGRSFSSWSSGHLTLSRDFVLISQLNDAGYAVAIPVRSGYYSAGGHDGEKISCNHPFKGEFEDAARSAGRDITQAIQMLGNLDAIDASRIAVMGYSAGGFGTLASMGGFPPGVGAVISLHGGRCGKRGPMFNGIEYASEIIRGAARQSAVPVLFISGTRDNIIPTEAVQHLRDVVCEARGAACKTSVSMVVVNDASHRVTGTIRRMDNELMDFLNGTLGPAQ